MTERDDDEEGADGERDATERDGAAANGASAVDEAAASDLADLDVPADAGSPDAGSPDAGSPDAGSPDAGSPDAGSPDAGSPDAGSPDAGSPEDGASTAEEAPVSGGTPSGAGLAARSRRGAELDDDSPESLRVTFAVLTALAACLCLLPRQWVSAAILGVVSFGLFVWHRIARRVAAKPAATRRPA